MFVVYESMGVEVINHVSSLVAVVKLEHRARE